MAQATPAAGTAEGIRQEHRRGDPAVFCFVISSDVNCQKPIFPTINAGRIAFIFCQLGVVYPILAPCNVMAAIVVITIAFFRDDTSAVAKEAQLVVVSGQDCTAASSISVA